MSVEEILHNPNDLVADIREETADFDAGVQSLFDELETIRVLLQQKETSLQAREKEITRQHEQMNKDSAPPENNGELLEQFNASFSRVEEEFAAAVNCMNLIPELCDSEEAHEEQVTQLQGEIVKAKNACAALEEDLSAERERSARLEASLTSAEMELSKQQQAFETEFAKLRGEIRDLGKPLNAQESEEQTKAPETESKSEAAAENQQPAASTGRSKRSRRRKKR